MAKPFTLLLVHHSHTDIGYTETQPRIERWHVDFIRQAMDAARARPGFRWVCETFWAVERFLAEAAPEERDALAALVRERRIGLSASYLNFSELIDAPVLGTVTARARRAAASWGGEVRCAMTADVNGFGWGFAAALLDAGAENLFTCVHTHHGMYPLGRTQVPFWWAAPDGRRLLVWNGEHYHLGNELGLVPGANSSYLIKDECDAATIFGDHRRVAETRLSRYVESLVERGYPYDFAPVMASGLRTDNGPPNPAILDAANWWNDTHGGSSGITVRMAVLEDVFDAVRASGLELPVHAGDWPDWWSDGPASRPASVKLFRRTQRDLAWLEAIETCGSERWVGVESAEPASEDGGVDDGRADLATDLALFAEHTCSHSDAMSAPWHEMVHTIDTLNEGHLARATASVGRCRDAARERLGGASLRPGLPLAYRVVHPFGAPVTDVARLGVSHYEFEELGLGKGFEVRDLEYGDVLPCELVHAPRGGEILVPLTFESAGERRLEVVPVANGRRAAEETALEDALETDHVRVAWRAPSGIVEIRDLAAGRDLLRPDAAHAAFQPIHDVTPVADRADVCAVRGRMGLNRKGGDAIVSEAETSGEARGRRGEVLATATLDYELSGTRLCELEIQAHRYAPRIDVALRLHKESLWAPENLYVSLPFSAGEGAETWLDKAGAEVRPREDQLPGTLTDFYAVQAGWGTRTRDFGIVVLMPDHHLLQLGPLAHGDRLLAGDPRLEDDPAHPYGWLMTNYWETNFTADLGGFYEFRYSLLWGAPLAGVRWAAECARASVHGLDAIRLERATS